MLDEQAAQIFAVTDEIAERVRKTGNTTLRSIGDIARHQTIKDNDKDFVAPDEMLKELRDDNLELVEHLREAKDIADDAKDNATSAMIDDWTDQAEGRAWFLFESQGLSTGLSRLSRLAERRAARGRAARRTAAAGRWCRARR